MIDQPEKSIQQLQERAKRSAREFATRNEEGKIFTVVEFSINSECYAIELIHIREIFPLKELTEIPGVPPFIRGVVNMRGQIISVVDIRQFFELPAKGFSDSSRIIVLRSPEMEYGILADAILGIRAIPESETVPGLPTLTGIRQDFLKAITHNQTVILDGKKLLSDPKMVVK
ncbi:MAG: purine-binding chemotaxis protein CheW [Magnetococcales bacterium]|nr:purine-binding chemotaxis protein CheW [Magnetococcales bacterium]